MNTHIQQILVDAHRQALLHEARDERLASAARRASASPRHGTADADDRRPGVLRRLVARLAV
jgi:hypothetical protein